MSESASEVFISAKRPSRKNRRLAPRPPLAQLVEQTRSELEQEGWTAKSLVILRDVLSESNFPVLLKVLCLGLGTPNSSSASRAQLAFLLEICAHLNIAHSEVSLCDPVFSEEDTSFLTTQGMRIASSNDNSVYVCATPTIVYMPHCDMELHEHVLSANYATSTLRNVFLVCNRLEDYVDHYASRKLASRVPLLARIVPFLRCEPLPSSSKWPSSFNNTSVQCIPPAKLKACSSALTDQVDKPELEASSADTKTGNNEIAMLGENMDRDRECMRVLGQVPGK